jgi:hypothetical protein
MRVKLQNHKPHQPAVGAAGMGNAQGGDDQSNVEWGKSNFKFPLHSVHYTESNHRIRFLNEREGISL